MSIVHKYTRIHICIQADLTYNNSRNNVKVLLLLMEIQIEQFNITNKMAPLCKWGHLGERYPLQVELVSICTIFLHDYP